jgi:hypothetical protein
MAVLTNSVVFSSARVGGKANIVAKASAYSCATVKISALGKIRSNNSRFNLVSSRLMGDSDLVSKYNITFGLRGLEHFDNSKITSRLNMSGVLRARVGGEAYFSQPITDKLAGPFQSPLNFQATEKLYPIRDIISNLNGNIFVDKYQNINNLYSSIDEGIFTGNYAVGGGVSKVISDDNASYIQPKSILTNGEFRYKFEVTRPAQVGKQSYLFIRAAAPVANYESNVPPRHTLSNLKLEDPSGNLIIKYKDIILRGESDYSSQKIYYTTYISEPEINNLLLFSWERNYPLMGLPSGYSLNIDVKSECLDDPFEEKFDEGYEDTCRPKFIYSPDASQNDYLALGFPPISTQASQYSINPTNSLRISAIEIGNSGGVGILSDNRLNFYSEVQPIGNRIIRDILPSEVLLKDFNTGIYPVASSVWKSSDGANYNLTSQGAAVLTNDLRDKSQYNYISLNYNTPVSNSGKLQLKFSHEAPTSVTELRGGAFSFGGLNKSLDTAKLQSIAETDNFFAIDSVELKIIAKKAIGGSDFSLDAVGYSDDKILNVTSAVGGFLQSVSGVGSIPTQSGFNPTNELGISTVSISNKDQFYNSVLLNGGGDHYSLTSLPVVNSTSFQEYTIPLKIYKDNVTLGVSKDYAQSSYFENLYLDLYPIPSGASFASIKLVVKYKPSNALALHTLANASTEFNRRTIHIYPSSGYLSDSYTQLSSIVGIPQSYKAPPTLKTNYARRWRGVSGKVKNGAFNPLAYDLSFKNEQLHVPFSKGYFTFNYDSNPFVVSDKLGENIVPISGKFNRTYNKLSNIGLRFNNQSLFLSPTPYKTIDWTSIAGYENHELYGKISDTYDNIVRLSGVNANINFGSVNTDNGFAIYTRFSPDISISGVGYNLFNSGVLFAKWDAGQNLEFALGYKNGYLCGYARDTAGNIITAQDSLLYSNYQYPLPVILTYNDNDSRKLKLYTDNEIASYDNLRAESASFIKATGDSNLIFGYCYGSGVGMNMFVSEIGISDSGSNLVSVNPNLQNKQITASDFLSSQSVRSSNSSNLWSYVDENTSDWKMGDFQILSFKPAFKSLTKRVGEDFIVHHIVNNGSGYSQITNTTLPASVITSGISYHTQIENDFLRLGLSDVVTSGGGFYTAYPRISKNLPRDYDFYENAFVVDTIIEYETKNNIVWSDGKIGPKLIVSLYTKNKDNPDLPSKNNLGLINRATHYLKPSGSISKINSKFGKDSLFDTSEPWASFNLDNIISEFDHKYYSKDINDMFLQYDVVYPTGSPYDSTIKIHSAHVRLENALVFADSSIGAVSLFASGEQKSVDTINLHSYGYHTVGENSGVPYMKLYTSGYQPPYSYLNLHTVNQSGLSTPLSLYSTTYIKVSVGGNTNYGSGPEVMYGANGNDDGFLFYVNGRGTNFNEQYMSLATKNLPIDQTSSGNLFLCTVAERGRLNLSDATVLYTQGAPLLTSSFPSETMSLVIQVPSLLDSVDNYTSLFTMGDDFTRTVNSSSLNLYVINYPPVNALLNQQATVSWNGNYVGKSINVDDLIYSSLKANDEIRGVDTVCYGNCVASGDCKELQVTTHGKAWSLVSDCVDGGVFRASNTYTNLQTSGFNTPIGYSGHFYGMRKYDGLIPNVPYQAIITGRTGTNTVISVPNEFEEVEYGSNSVVGYSGVKIVSTSRHTNDQFGKSIAVKNDVMAVGAPMMSVTDDYNYTMSEAGSVFIYKRNAAPSGYNWTAGSDKASWALETQLTLPQAYLRDYYTERKKTIIIGQPDITERFWNVGQEGRQFGHSVSLGIDSGVKSLGENSRQVLVVGGPSSKWNRTFEDLKPSGIQIGLMIFTDEFKPTITLDEAPWSRTYRDILNSVANKDILYKYYGSPPVSFDVKLVILEPTLDDDTSTLSLDFDEPKPTFITKKQINRNFGLVNDITTAKILSGIKSAFHETFPYDSSKLHNNIPPLVGFYVDNSRSLGREALEPAIDQFVQYYKDYSFASGVRDFYGVRSSGAITEFTPDVGAAEDWVIMGQTVLNYTLDTGRLVRDDQIRFLTSGVGVQYYNTNLGEFNHSPPSGGRVYIFEKESGSWNLIQQINSPVDVQAIPDRFGHAVSISDNTEIIAIGSPYINDACKVYEYKPEEKDRLYSNLGSWLAYKSSVRGGIGRFANLLSDYTSLARNNNLNAGKTMYLQLTASEKYEARQYLDINEYADIYTYGYGNIPMVGTWGFLADKFLPTSRLGYSAAVNEDGSIVAFGAPTDSLNQWDDINVSFINNGYYEPLNIDKINGPITTSWKSNTNAGAVRVFDSRKYYPHNSAVEFTFFGNLQQSSSDPADIKHYNYVSGILRDKNFKKTDFSDPNIPQNAGLAFIITPEVDAISDEVVNNITSWLSLGDRNLVLVGNDPIWEQSGIYQKSNDIINKLLEKVNSKMRLYPARNAKEALSDGIPTQNNIMRSFRPDHATYSPISTQSLKGYGVADIRIHFPNYYASSPCDQAEESQLNNKCELPLIHEGDLRAQWLSSCVNCQFNLVIYPVNWPLVFQNYIPPCCQASDISVNTYSLAGKEPTPLLVAAGYTDPQTIYYPATPATSGLFPIYKTNRYTTYSTITQFSNSGPNSGIEFIWSHDSGNYSYLNTNIGATVSAGRFYEPEIVEDRASLLQAFSTTDSYTTRSKIQLEPNSTYCAEQLFANSSKVIVIAGLSTETPNSLNQSIGDNNINFYANMVYKQGGARIAQLNSWTGRSSFIDAYDNSSSATSYLFSNAGTSSLYSLFKKNRNDVTLNVDQLSDTYDVCWIANPAGLPSTSQLQEIKDWLNAGNKKLIITYDNSVDKANNMKKLFAGLGLDMEPYYIPVRDKYASSVGIGLTLTDNYISRGINNKFTIQEFNSFVDSFIPIKLGTNASPICYANPPIEDDSTITTGFWRLKSGVAKVTFPVAPGSGYRIFIDSIAETPAEIMRLNVLVSNVNTKASLPPATLSAGQYSIQDINNTSNTYYEVAQDTIGYSLSAGFNGVGNAQTNSFNVQIPSGVSSINMYFSANASGLNQNYAYIPKTVRLLGISGVLLPIENKVLTNEYSEQEQIGYEWRMTSNGSPEGYSTIPSRFIPFSSDNTPYCTTITCGLGGQLIEDGPVVVAQEAENVSSFTVGQTRSTITLVGDSSIIQGPLLAGTNGVIPDANYAFIRSLYPSVSFSSENNGRQFNVLTKIVSPERGSPQKLYSMIGNSGNNLLFNIGSMSRSALSNFNDSESKYSPDYVIRPENPWKDYYTAEEIEIIKTREINKFELTQIQHGATAKFSGIIEGVMYTDSAYRGGMPKLMQDTKYDYLDIDRFPSGYRGDLFGYSIDLSKNKLVVGAPFSAFSQDVVQPWNYYVSGGVSSGIKASYNGGAGSVYIFERTYKGSGILGAIVPWEFTQKLRPLSINVGQDLSSTSVSQSGVYLGTNNYSSQELSQNTIINDQFGYDVSIDSDIMAVGSPGHDFSNYIIGGSGAFIRKSFSAEFNIPNRKVIDIGQSGVRYSTSSSGTVLNNGAVFMFENKIVDWPTKLQKWTLVEKVVPVGYNSRLQKNGSIIPSGTENDYFGKSVSISQCSRTDADYTLAIATPYHTFGSGTSSPSLSKAGSAYIFDTMLRKQASSFYNSNSFIQAKVYGERDQFNNPQLFMEVKNNDKPDTRYYVSGIIYTNNQGEIFLEASGQDPVSKGFIEHRPYIESIDAYYMYGKPVKQGLRLFNYGKELNTSSKMNVFTNVDDTAFVYNTLGLYESAIVGFASGIPSGLGLYLDCPNPIVVSSGMNLFMASGIGINTESLPIAIRGK